jgi:hypothetical protein
MSFQWSLCFWLSKGEKPVCIPLLPHACNMPCPSHPPWLDRSNYTWQRVHAVKLLTMKFSPFSYYFFPLRPKYSPQHTVPRYFQSVLPLMSGMAGHNLTVM